jgi:DNA-binding MarR family transcriptional regulator
MRADEVARRHQFREGFNLVDYAEVGLPVFRLTIEAVTTTFRSIPAIQEFVMRCMALDEGSEAAIAGMLGLKLDLVEGAVNGLVSDGLASRAAAPGDQATFRLTEAGERRLAEEREEVPQEEMLVIDYDGIRRMPIRLAGENVMRASDLKLHGAVEVRPYPAEPPPISELSIPDVSRVIRRQGGDEFRRTVLALKRIVRRNNVFREAVALVYAADRGAEVQVAFAIDGQLSEAHERAFAEHGGPRKMGFLRAINEGDARKRLERLIGKEMLARTADADRLIDFRREDAAAREEIRAILPAAQVGSGGRSGPAAAALQAAKEKLSVAGHAIGSLAVRPMAPFEQNDLLEEALTNARRQLIVTSAGIWPHIVNGYMLRALDHLMSERVEIDIATCVAPQPEPRNGDAYDPVAELTRRSRREALRLLQIRQCEHYFLIQDDELAVVSNRPFLGDIARRVGFQRVQGLVVRSRPLVAEIRDIAISSLEVKGA